MTTAVHSLVRPTRRSVAALLLAAAGPVPAWAASTSPVGGPLAFEVWRNGSRIGHHRLSFRGPLDEVQVEVEAHFQVKLGPLSVFDYRHHGTERWRGGRFASLETHSTTNGKVEQVIAQRTDEAVTIDTGARKLRVSPDHAPLTHWNARVLAGPLFNPQTGETLRETLRRGEDPALPQADGRTIRAARYALTGTVEITDWYDSNGVWTALRGKAKDGSVVEYRRV